MRTVSQKTEYQYRRTLWLAHTSMLRQMIRSGRHQSEGRRCLKEAQQHMAFDRSHCGNLIPIGEA